MKTWKFDTWLKDENGEELKLSTGDRVAILINKNGNYKCQLYKVGGVYKKGFNEAQKSILKAVRKWEASL